MGASARVRSSACLHERGVLLRARVFEHPRSQQNPALAIGSEPTREAAPPSGRREGV